MDGRGTAGGSTEAAQALQALAESLRDCSGCRLCGGRTQVVFGVGSPTADLMFVGEGPGFHEDRQGEPFVGQAGKLLTELLGGIGLGRQDVYIANVVKCRPPENRDPAPDEIEACSPHLMEQIAVIRPSVVCTLGRFATKLLADTELSMTAIHGMAKQRTLAGVDVMVFPVFHPAAALYAPANRQVLGQDFEKLRRLLEVGMDAMTSATIAGDVEPLADAEAGPSDAGQTGLSGDAAAKPRPVAPRTEQLPLW